MAIDEQPIAASAGEQPPLALGGNGAAVEVHAPIDREELQDLCVGLLQRGLPRRQYAVELARVIGEAGGAKAVAILTYNRRRHRLGLLADYALPEEAREALEGGTQYTWDIPIRGLRNRRISVIEAAHRNPFVPAAVVAISPDDLIVACIPVYHDNLPTAVVLFFNTSARSLSDADLHSVTLAVRVGARGLRETTVATQAGAEEVEAEEGEASEAPEDRLPPFLVRGADGLEIDAAEMSSLRRGLATLQEQKDSLTARLERADEDLARARVDVERGAQTARTLTSSRQAVVQERDRLKTELEEIERSRETELAQLRSEVSALEDRLMVAESDRLRHQRAADQLRGAREQSVLALERERDSLLERVRGAEAGIAAVQGALGSVREDRDRLAAQAETLTRQVQAGQAAMEELRARHEQELAGLAAEHDNWKEQAATAEMGIARRSEDQRILEHQLRDVCAARDASVEQVRLAHAELAQVSGLHQEALDRAQLAEAARAAALAESESLREVLSSQHAEHQRGEMALRADIEIANAAIDRATAGAATVQARVAELERFLAEREAQIGKLQQERELVGQDAQTIQSTLAHLETEARQQVESLTAERDALDHRAQKAEQTLAVESERAQAEARRAASLAERVSQFQASLAQAEAKRTALSGQVAQAQTELEALREQSTDRGQLARQITELSSKVIQNEKLLEAARDEARQLTTQLSSTERQRAALAKGLQTAHREHQQISASVERGQESLREGLEGAKAVQARLEKEKREATEALQTQKANHAAALAEAQATLEQLRAERDRAIAERDQHAGSIASAQMDADARATLALQDTHGLGRRLAERERRIDEIADVLRQRDAALERASEERRELSESVHAAETVLLDVRREVESLREELGRERQEHAEAFEELERKHRQEVQLAQRAAEERETKARLASILSLEERRAARYDAPLIIERSDDKGTVVVESGPASAEAAQEDLRLRLGDGAIYILDRGALCEDAVAVLRAAGIEALGVDPTEAGIEGIGSRTIGTLLLNVAAGPTAWELVRKLRERPTTKHVPILAYLMTPEAANGFCFGRCDFALWPTDLGDLVEQLQRMRPMVRRLLIASSDVEALGRVREPLAKARISASNVLDGKQARDLGHSLQPEAAVLHFSPTCSDIARALSSYRQIEATRDLPILLMLDKSGSARESIFFQAANRELLRSGRFDFSQLPDELIRLRTPR